MYLANQDSCSVLALGVFSIKKKNNLKMVTTEKPVLQTVIHKLSIFYVKSMFQLLFNAGKSVLSSVIIVIFN